MASVAWCCWRGPGRGGRPCCCWMRRPAGWMKCIDQAAAIPRCRTIEAPLLGVHSASRGGRAHGCQSPAGAGQGARHLDWPESRCSAPRASMPRAAVRAACPAPPALEPSDAGATAGCKRVPGWQARFQGHPLDVRRGECWVVHGANGAGKSTLLRTIYGDHGVASGGLIERAGISPGVPLQEFRARTALVSPQLQADYPPYASVLETVVSGLHSSIGLNEAASPAERRRARKALQQHGLGEIADRTLGEISYGQKRRVLFARASMTGARLWLLDEPFAGLDSQQRALVAAERGDSCRGRGRPSCWRRITGRSGHAARRMNCICQAARSPTQVGYDR